MNSEFFELQDEKFDAVCLHQGVGGFVQNNEKFVFSFQDTRIFFSPLTDKQKNRQTCIKILLNVKNPSASNSFQKKFLFELGISSKIKTLIILRIKNESRLKQNFVGIYFQVLGTKFQVNYWRLWRKFLPEIL